jgi:hypothetical protein
MEVVSFKFWLLYPQYPLNRILGEPQNQSGHGVASSSSNNDFQHIMYIKICTFWRGFIPTTLSIKSLVPYRFIHVPPMN